MSDNDQLADMILSVAEFAGYQTDGKGGEFQLWHLKKQVGSHPVGSTVSRETLRRHLVPLKKETP